MIAFVYASFLAFAWVSINTGLTIRKHGFGHMWRRFAAWQVGMSYRCDYMVHHWSESRGVQKKWAERYLAEVEV